MQIFEYITEREIFRRKPARQASAVEWRMLGRWVLCGHGRREANWQTVEWSVQRQGQPRDDLQRLHMFEFGDARSVLRGRRSIVKKEHEHHR